MGHRKRNLLLVGVSALALLTAAPVQIDWAHGHVGWSVAQAKSCFVGEARVLMADLTWRPIRALGPGDRVLGAHGRANRVLEVERPRLGGRKLYALNGGMAFVTAEHPFLTAAGWKAIEPEATRRETVGLAVGALALGDLLAVRAVAGPGVYGALALAPGIAATWEQLVRIVAVAAEPTLTVYNLLLDGDHTYVVEGYVVHNKDGGDGGEGEGGGGEGGGGGGSGESESEGGDNSGSGSENSGSDSESSGSGSESSGSGEAGENNSGPGSSGSGRGSEDDDDHSGSGGSHSGGGHSEGSSGLNETFGGDATPATEDLSEDEEAAAISHGWQ